MNTSADKELKDLNPQERAYALKILEELQKNGNSKLYEDLVYSDYKEIPTDIPSLKITDIWEKHGTYQMESVNFSLSGKAN